MVAGDVAQAVVLQVAHERWNAARLLEVVPTLLVVTPLLAPRTAGFIVYSTHQPLRSTPV